MKFPLLRPAVFTALAAALFVQTAMARNVAIVHPVAAVLSGKAGRAVVSDLRIAFGGATAVGGTVLTSGFAVDGIGRADYIGNRRPTDAEVCDRALLDALTQLVLAARKAGANGIVGIVSNYENRSFDDPNNVECRAGTFRSHVLLKADFVRLDATQPPMATAAASAVPARLEHARIVPAASGFADIHDVGAVPLRAEGQADYQRYLTLPPPKAFGVLANGGWRFYWKDAEAMTKVLDHCARVGEPCWLYAVDDRVVWTASPATRIGQSRQLVRAEAARAP